MSNGDLTAIDGSKILTQNLGEGEVAPDWMAQNPDNLKTNKFLSQFSTLGDASKALIDFAGKYGAVEKEFKEYKTDKSIPKLGDNPTPEELTAYYKQLGKPDSPDAYEFTEPTLPDGMARDEKLLNTFRTLAHTANLTPAQAKTVQEGYNKYMIEQFEAVQAVNKAKQDEAIKELQKIWIGDQYKVNTELAKRAAKTAGGEEFLKFLEETRLGDNPEIVKVFHFFATKLGDDSLVPGTPSTTPEVKRTDSGIPMFTTYDKTISK